jgi:hypothetical protein
LSSDLAVALAPARVWPRIAKVPSTHHWLTRPLFALFLYGCAASLLMSGRVTLRLLPAAMLQAIYVPLFQIAGLAVVCRGALPLRRAVDLFYAGHAPVSLLLLALASAWGFAPTGEAFAQMVFWAPAALVALAWSAYVDYHFYRSAAGRGAGGAIGAVLLHRLLWWIPALAVFCGPAAWQELLHKVGL